ncbi:MAG: class I SAM-dependent methyltransferase [Planctomycetaceae bacterium]|nr:class I SAM-dependent methyltransferase [Planctomycetaceae bacterium]
MRRLTVLYSRLSLLVISGVAIGTMPATADETSPPAAAQAETRYEYRDDHDPNGIGKFYMGREIAYVMGHQGISWLERREREQEERLSLLMDGLKLEPGMIVADIGAGSGVISRLIAKRIGPTGTVVAVDIQQEMLDALTARNKLLGIENIQAHLGTVKSPELGEETIDLVVMVDVYHEFDHPFEMLQEIARSLKPGGRVAFVEYRKEDPDVPIKEVHKMAEAQVKREAQLPEFRLEWVETFGKLPRQHVVIFRKLPMAGGQERPSPR